jgi:hypothetical protein
LANVGKTRLDWVHVPPGSAVESLWECLHDAELCSIRSDLLARSAVLEFDVGYLRRQLGLPDDVRFRFELSGVASLRASVYVSWPGPQNMLAGTDSEEHSSLIAEYRAKGREETIGWRPFETDLSSTGFDVADAYLASGEDQIALQIEGSMDSGWCTLHLAATRLAVSRTDDVAFSLAQFLKAGKAYWQAFSEGRLDESRAQAG